MSLEMRDDLSSGLPPKGEGMAPEVDLRSYVEIIARRRWWLTTPILAALAAALLYVTVSSPVYLVQADLQIPAVSPTASTSVSGVLGTLSGFMGTGGVEEEVQILKSWPLQERALALLNKHLSLWEECTKGKRRIQSLRDIPEEVRKTFEECPEILDPPDRQLKLLRSVQAIPIRGTSMLRLSILTPNYEEGCNLLNALCAAYILYRKANAELWSEVGLQQIRRQLKQTEAQLRAAEAALEEFQKEHQVVSPESQATKLVDLKATLEARVNDIRAQLPREQAVLEHLQRSLKGQNPQVATARVPVVNPIVKQLEERLNQLYMQRMELLVEYTEESQKVKAIDAQIDEVKKKLEQVPREIMAPVTETQSTAYLNMVDQWVAQQAKVIALRAELPAVRRALARVMEQMSSMPELAVEYARLKREVEVQQTAYLQLRQQEQQYIVARESQLGKAQVIAPARVPPWMPKKRVRPRPVPTLLLALLVGLTSGVLLALGVDYFHNAYPTLELAEAAIGIPLLGSICHIRARGIPLVDGEDIPEGFVEDLRGTRLSLSFALGGSAHNVVCIVSPGRAEGKTTIACNLGLLEAETGGSSVVVDCNLQSPMVHEAFGIDPGPGLQELMREEASIDDVIQFPRGTQSLAVVPAGHAAETNAVGLQFKDKKFVSFLEELRHRFGLVILDGPQGSKFGDAQVLAVSADATVLVVVPGRTRRDNTRRTLMLLGQAGARLIGLVGNMVGSAGGSHG